MTRPSSTATQPLSRHTRTYDDSKQRLAEIRQAEAELKAKADSVSATDTESRRKRGGQPKAGSKTAVERETGISRQTQQRVEQHVAIADRFPFMQRGSWKQHHVLEAGSLLDAYAALTADQRRTIRLMFVALLKPGPLAQALKRTTTDRESM